jgi:hypothetical protein
MKAKYSYLVYHDHMAEELPKEHDKPPFCLNFATGLLIFEDSSWLRVSHDITDIGSYSSAGEILECTAIRKADIYYRHDFEVEIPDLPATYNIPQPS